MRNFQKYGKITSALYFLPSLGIAPSMKPAYFFCRIVDDIADGDSPLPNGVDNFEDLCQKLSKTIYNNDESESGERNEIELILIDAINKLGHTTKEGDDIKKDFADFIEAMRDEYKRRYSRTIFTQDQLDVLFDKSFASVINLALTGLGSKNRISDVSTLGRLQGKVYALRDLKDDLKMGIFNIPKDVIEEGGLDAEGLIQTPEKATDNSEVQNWVKAESVKCREMIAQLKRTKLDTAARKMVDFLVAPLEKVLDLH